MAKRTVVLEIIDCETGKSAYVRGQCDGVQQMRPGSVEIRGLSSIAKERIAQAGENVLIYLTEYKNGKPVARIV